MIYLRDGPLDIQGGGGIFGSGSNNLFFNFSEANNLFSMYSEANNLFSTYSETNNLFSHDFHMSLNDVELLQKAVFLQCHRISQFL